MVETSDLDPSSGYGITSYELKDHECFSGSKSIAPPTTFQSYNMYDVKATTQVHQPSASGESSF